MPLDSVLGIPGMKPGICTSTTRPANPYRGQTIIETDTMNLLMYYGTTTGWKLPWNIPWGLLDSSTNSTSNVTGIGSTLSGALVTSASVYSLNRKIKLTGHAYFGTAAASLTARLFTMRGVSQLGVDRARGRLISGGEPSTLQMYMPDVIDSSGSASNTYSLAAATSTSTMDCLNTTVASIITVEDVGPNGPPPSS